MPVTRPYYGCRFNLSGTFAADIPANTQVKISADETFAQAALANDHVVGHVLTPRDGNNRGTVEMMRYNELLEDCVVTENVVAGEFAKRAADASGEPRFAKFVPGTDAEERKLGLYFKGATNGNKAKILIF